MVALCAATAATAALTGCNTDDNEGASAPLAVPAATTEASATSAASGKDDPFSSMTADGVLSLAEADMRAAGALTVSVNALEEGETMQLKAALTAAGKCAATLRSDGMTMQLITTDAAHAYLKGDAGYWRTVGGAKGAELAAAVGDRWVKLSKKVLERGSLDEFCSFDGLILSMLSDDADSDTVVVKGTPTTLDGRQVLPLIEELDDETDTMYVSTGKTPYIVKLEGKGGDSPGSATFSDFGKAPHITAPPASQTVDMNDLGVDLSDKIAI